MPVCAERKKGLIGRLVFIVFYVSSKGRVRFRSCIAGAVEAVEGLE